MAIAVAQDRRMFIDGDSVEAAGGAWLEVHSPATGALAGRVPAGTAATWSERPSRRIRTSTSSPSPAIPRLGGGS